jgi:hypothetical protein
LAFAAWRRRSLLKPQRLHGIHPGRPARRHERGHRGDDEQPLATQWAAVSNDGQDVYITAGTASGGPLFTPQPGRVLVVDAARRRLTGEILLNDWRPKEVLVF